MGMYTQVRGFLCVGSINSNFKKLESEFNEAKNEYKKTEGLDRLWIADNFHIMQGSNGSAWIFVGAEFKNYDESMDRWIEYLCSKMKCEGRIEYQYEEYGEGETDKVWLIKDSVITIEDYNIHTVGYGFNI